MAAIVQPFALIITDAAGLLGLGLNAAQRDVWGESAGKSWDAFVGIFVPDRLNSRSEIGAKALKIMTMVGDSEAEWPPLKGDVPLVFLLNCIRDCIRVKQYSPHTEQPYLDWIRRFIHFHGKRHRQRSRPTFGT
jgi:hypothetical protein